MARELLPVAVLAGGLATRLRPVTQTIPKALIEVAGEPFLVHQMRLLYARGIRRVVLCAGYLGEMIATYLDEHPMDMSIEVVFDGPRLLGTAGALRQAAPRLGPAFFVLYGDSYLPCDYLAVQEAFEGSGRQALMTIYHNEGRWDRSNVEFADGEIRNYDKTQPTPRMEYIDYGLGVLSSSALGHVPAGEPCDLAALYQDLLRQGELAAYPVQQRFYEVGSFSGLQELQHLLSGDGPGKLLASQAR